MLSTRLQALRTRPHGARRRMGASPPSAHAMVELFPQQSSSHRLSHGVSKHGTASLSRALRS